MGDSKIKANNGKGNIEDRDDWETPNLLFDRLDEQYKFIFDCCASKNNKKCLYWSKDFKEIKTALHYVCWMNPPFSKARGMFEHFFKVIKRGIAIFRCDNMETKIWQEIILKHADWVFIPKGRIVYQYNSKLRQGKGPRFPSAFIGIGVEPPKLFEGVCLKVFK